MFDFTGGHALDNQQASKAIFGVAALLESLGANPFRVRAYRRAALGMLRLPDAAARHTNSDGELDLPWLGPRLRRKLGELVRQGRMQFHEELLAELPRPMRELLAVPGVGPKTAARLIDELRVESVEALARAAREGRLRQLRGFGPRREQQLGLAAESLLTAAA
jgi:DNA polymerase (family 10)